MANKRPSALTAATALDGTEIFHGVQGGNSRKVTGNQIRTLALGAFGANGLAARTAVESFAARSIVAPAAGIAVANGDGIAGNPTLALTNDLAALEGLGSTGIAVRSAVDTWVQRSIAAGAGISIANADGVSGNPSIAIDEASAAQFRSNTADKVLSTDQIWAAADYVALTDGGTIGVDMSSGFNFSITLGGNRTLDNPTNAKNGQTGAIVIAQDGTGSRTLSYGGNWKFAGGTDPTLSTAADAVDVLFYQVISPTVIVANVVKAIA